MEGSMIAQEVSKDLKAKDDIACGAHACAVPVQRLRIGCQKLVLVTWIFHRKLESYVIGRLLICFK